MCVLHICPFLIVTLIPNMTLWILTITKHNETLPIILDFLLKLQRWVNVCPSHPFVHLSVFALFIRLMQTGKLMVFEYPVCPSCVLTISRYNILNNFILQISSTLKYDNETCRLRCRIRWVVAWVLNHVLICRLVTARVNWISFRIVSLQNWCLKKNISLHDW